MLFSGAPFLFFFLPAVLFCYYVILRKTKSRNFFLFFASVFFYAWGEPVYVLLLLASIFGNYLFGLWAEKTRLAKKGARVMLCSSLLFNLSLIFFFKYYGFFAANANALFGLSLPELAPVLPIGISFFTFQAISYVVDIYRGKGAPQKNIFDMGLYIALFPQLIAGPIVRYETVALQINSRKETWEDFSSGVSRFVFGLGKKVILANTMARIADTVFDAAAVSSAAAWLGAIAYALQIYYDFSGYSDMAIGLGQMFGFKFLENFDYPYISKSITEFWRRWHISLGTWFRDYVYFPMGGSRVKKPRLIFNLFVVWGLTGLWHGASWNFVLWGLYFFVLLSAEKLILGDSLKALEQKGFFAKLILRLYTLTALLLGWVLFRAETLPAAGAYLKAMFSAPAADELFYSCLTLSPVILFAAVLFSAPTGRLFSRLCESGSPIKKLCGVLYPAAVSALFIVCAAYIVKGTYNPFIYFNF